MAEVVRTWLGIDKGQWSPGAVLSLVLAAATVAEYVVGGQSLLLLTVVLCFASGLAAVTLVVRDARSASVSARWGARGLFTGTVLLVAYQAGHITLPASQLGSVVIGGVVVLSVAIAAVLAYRFGGLLPAAFAPVALWVPLVHPITRDSYVSFAEEPTTGWVLLGTVALTLALGGSLALVGYTLGVAARLEFGDPADRRPWVTALGHGTLLLAPVTVLAFVLLPLPLALAGFGLPLGCGVLVFSAN